MLGLTNTSGTWDQCSRLKPSYEFHFWRALKFQPFNWRVGSNPRRQSKNLEKEIQNSYYNLCMNYMVHVSSTMWKKIKNQPSNSTSCSDNALARLLVLVVGQVSLHFQFGVAFWRVVLKEVYFQMAKSHSKSIEDFNLEQCLPPCWDLLTRVGLGTPLWIGPQTKGPATPYTYLKLLSWEQTCGELGNASGRWWGIRQRRLA